jgi:hypothetical protein
MLSFSPFVSRWMGWLLTNSLRQRFGISCSQFNMMDEDSSGTIELEEMKKYIFC